MIEYAALIPLSRRLIVQADPPGLGASGIIERPETVEEQPCSGRIVAMSPDMSAEERRGLKVGDHIMWSPKGGASLSGGGIPPGTFVLDWNEPWLKVRDAHT